MINYSQLEAHFTPQSEQSLFLTRADKEVIVDFLNDKIKETIYDLEDDDMDFVANSLFYHDDFFYERARDIVLEELEKAALCDELDDYFEDEIPNANALKTKIIAFAKKSF